MKRFDANSNDAVAFSRHSIEGSPSGRSPIWLCCRAGDRAHVILLSRPSCSSVKHRGIKVDLGKGDRGNLRLLKGYSLVWIKTLSRHV